MRLLTSVTGRVDEQHPRLFQAGSSAHGKIYMGYHYNTEIYAYPFLRMPSVAWTASPLMAQPLLFYPLIAKFYPHSPFLPLPFCFNIGIKNYKSFVSSFLISISCQSAFTIHSHALRENLIPASQTACSVFTTVAPPFMHPLT